MVKPRRHGRFSGYRINCERVPCLPARVVAAYLADPRRIPYLLIWRYRGKPIERAFNTPNLGEPREAVRLAPYSFREGEAPEPDWVEIKRWNGDRIGIRVLERPLPRNGGKSLLLICHSCSKPRRALYGRGVDKQLRRIWTSLWYCRSCNGLSYASEGGALVFRTRWKPFRSLSGLPLIPRPEVWEPEVFPDPTKAQELGLC